MRLYHRTASLEIVLSVARLYWGATATGDSIARQAGQPRRRIIEGQ
jgi:hypothetical protein